MPYLLDTNIILRIANRDASNHIMVMNAVKRLAASGERLYLVPQCLYEFWSATTRPTSVNGLGWTALQARLQVGALIEIYELLPDTNKVFSKWLELVTLHGVSGKPSHDARLVAAMHTHGITHFLTLNGDDFKRYTEIKSVDPSELQA
jgi:predicted nucleic acid-binding protein